MGTAMPIDWHKINYVNATKSAVRIKKEIEQLQERLTELQTQNEILYNQIEEAERQGKLTFDSDKFMRNKRRIT